MQVIRQMTIAHTLIIHIDTNLYIVFSFFNLLILLIY